MHINFFYNRAKELYCDATIFVFWFFIVYLLKKKWKLKNGPRLPTLPYSDAIPPPCIDSITITLALAEQFISRFGYPKAIHTDQGSQFISRVMKSFCQIFKIQQIRSTAFQPQSLESLEQTYHTFIEYLKRYCTKRDWDNYIRFCIFSYNTAVYESTGLSTATAVENLEKAKTKCTNYYDRYVNPRNFKEFQRFLLAPRTHTQFDAGWSIQNSPNVL